VTEERLDAFEQAWRTGTPPRMEDFVPHAPIPLSADEVRSRRQFLEQLVRIDLEYSWRPPVHAEIPADRKEAKLESYVVRFPELGAADRLPADLIGWEYLIRRRYGDRPEH